MLGKACSFGPSLALEPMPLGSSLPLRASPTQGSKKVYNGNSTMMGAFMVGVYLGTIGICRKFLYLPKSFLPRKILIMKKNSK